jgi:hypothetical protein
LGFGRGQPGTPQKNQAVVPRVQRSGSKQQNIQNGEVTTSKIPKMLGFFTSKTYSTIIQLWTLETPKKFKPQDQLFGSIISCNHEVFFCNVS